MVCALIALLALAVSAGAQVVTTGTVAATSTGPGVNGIDLTTETDTSPLNYTTPLNYSAPTNDGLGVPSGAIKHVWVIVLENHAYENNFTGLNDNSYTSKVLPSVGAELTNYYGTGHSSLDNYTSMVSGQGPLTDDQADCPAYNSAAGTISTTGTLTTNGNYGQLASAAGPNAPAGDNGCVYPSSVPTLFNQLDANKTSWKVYAQDLDYSATSPSSETGTSQAAAPAGQNAGQQYCGAPDATPGATPSATQATNPGNQGQPSYVVGGASASDPDQYVAKHNPLPWFASMLNSGDCTSSASTSHLAPLLGANDQLYPDLQSESSTPSFSYIVPDNCSNGHDSICYGNNLSGGFSSAGNGQTPNPAVNKVGGAYSADLFLEHVVPEIMKSPAYSDGGLISVVWDEAYPQFTYSNDSFANSPITNGTAYNSLNIDEAGETLYGRSLNWEPTGPNTPNVYSQVGQSLSAGPGYNQYLDRPGSYSVKSAPTTTVGTTTNAYTLTNAVTNAAQSPLVPCTGGSGSGNGYNTITQNGCYAGGARATGQSAATTAGITVNTNTPSIATEDVTGTSSNYSAGGLISVNSQGQQVYFPSSVNGTAATAPAATVNGTAYNGPIYVGQVTSSLPAALPADDTTGTQPTDTTPADQGPVVTFQLVDANGNPVSLTGGYSGQIYLGGETAANDPLYDAFDGTSGGGDTGALMISPLIKGGTVSNTYYNHYSLLRSLEDIFNVSNGGGNSSQTGYTGSINVSTGLDGSGHLGYAAQPGLAPFGTDVFTQSPYDTTTSTSTVTSTKTVPVTSTVNKTVTQTITQSLPGSIFTVTTPGGTTKIKVKVIVVYVPRLVGLTLAEAKAELSAAGLKTGSVKTPKSKRGYHLVVSGQSTGAGRQTTKGTKVNLTLALKKG